MDNNSDEKAVQISNRHDKQSDGEVLNLIPRIDRDSGRLGRLGAAFRKGSAVELPIGLCRAGMRMIPGRPLPERLLWPEQETTMRTQLSPDVVAGELKPPITLSAKDHQGLSSLARAAANSMPELASMLIEELERAHVISNQQCPGHTVCMGSEIEFRDDTTAKVQTVRLVYPEEADISQGKISVLTPVGTALIGLREGYSITWETYRGDMRRLTVLQVRERQLV
jgi:regulator of nucleoside diphosphate kinase